MSTGEQNVSRLVNAKIVAATTAVVLLGIIAASTKIVQIGSIDDDRKKAFSKEEYGAATFPDVFKFVIEHAVDVKELGPAIAVDPSAAGKKYGTATGTGPVIPVKFTGVAGEVSSGIYKVAVDGLDDVLVRVQTGPAINGTELRDASGTISFGQFTNQIEYQDAGAAINNAMKKAVLQPVDTANLAGKKIAVTGAFKLINPKGWLVTPVKLEVK